MSVQNVQTLGTQVVGQPVAEDDDVKVEGIGSGFIWDKFGHIVRLPNSLHGSIPFALMPKSYKTVAENLYEGFTSRCSNLKVV